MSSCSAGVDERIRKESNLSFEKYVPRRYLQNQACIDLLSQTYRVYMVMSGGVCGDEWWRMW